MRKTRSSLALSGAVLLAVACGGDEGGVDGSREDGSVPRVDGGPRPDVAIPEDGGPPPDLMCDTSIPSLDAAVVQTALAAITTGGTASDPHVVCLPAGMASWTERVSWDAPPHAVLLGAGSLSTVGGGDRTVITDDFAENRSLLSIQTSASGTFRLAAITFRGGTGGVKENGLVSIGGGSTEMRADHLHIDMQTYAPLNSGKPMALHVPAGVVDHSIFDHAQQGFVHFLNGGGLAGDEAWAAPTDFGGPSFIFMEDNVHNGGEDPGNPGRYYGAISDCHTGGRFVIRYSTIISLGVGQTHPTGHGAGHDRGCRAHEIYGNTVMPAPDFDPSSDEPPFTFDYTTSGAALFWGNTATGVFKNFLYFNVVRQNDTPYLQIDTPDGWGHCGTEFDGIASGWDGNTDPLTGYPCIDQPGRGRGDLLTGDFPTEINSVTGTLSWPNQALEPIYEWANTATVVEGWGGGYVANLSNGRVAENRDYYLSHENTGCDRGAASCTTGVGQGARAERPSSCTEGVAWWSTDQGGDWHRANATPNDGTLDVCTAANTWTDAYYTPYRYPHPLVR